MGATICTREIRKAVTAKKGRFFRTQNTLPGENEIK